MESFLAHEWNWFRDCDAFQLWFYDPGGCLCARCREDLCAPLLRQVEMARRVVRAASPKARVEISLWPIWAWERRLGKSYGEELLDRLRATPVPKEGLPVLVDSAEGDDAFLEEAHALRFPMRAFLFSTNVETPFAFLHPLPRWTEAMVRRVQDKRLDAGYVHSLFPVSKELATLIGLRTLSQPEVARQDRVRDACRIYLGDRGAASRLAPLLETWEDLLAGPRPDPADARSLAASVDRALGALSTPEADVVRTSIHAVAEILAPLDEPLAPRLSRLLAASPPFRAFAPVAAAEHAALRTFVQTGWNHVHY